MEVPVVKDGQNLPLLVGIVNDWPKIGVQHPYIVVHGVNFHAVVVFFTDSNYLSRPSTYCAIYIFNLGI